MDLVKGSVVDVGRRFRSKVLLLVADEVLSGSLNSSSLHTEDGLVSGLSLEVRTGDERKLESAREEGRESKETKRAHSAPNPSQFRPPSAVRGGFIPGPRAMLTEEKEATQERQR